MGKQLTTKLKSQSGASFSFALLLFLVCIMVSSIVIAASSASAGRLVNQGESDQRYYSVTSAAQLFCDSLDGSTPDAALKGDTGSLRYTLTESRTGTRTITRTQAGATTETFAEDKSKAEALLNKPAHQTGTTSPGYDFLTDITHYALFGVSAAQANTGSETALLRTKNWGSWIATGTSNTGPLYTFGGAGEQAVTYKADVSLSGTPASSLSVEATAQLNSDWTCDLYFYNSEADQSARLYLYLQLSADVSEDIVTSEQLEASTSVDSSGTTTNTEVVNQVKTTTVTWRIERVVPGRGPVSEA